MQASAGDRLWGDVAAPLTVATPTLYGGQVLVIRERHWCQWGSPYLDAYGEEDQDLRRGRPLYLNRSVWVGAHARVGGPVASASEPACNFSGIGTADVCRWA